MGPTWRCRLWGIFCLLHTVLVLILSGQACGLENGFNGNDSCRISSTSNEQSVSMCPNKGRCSELLFDCFSCKYDHECIYGQETSGNCTVCDANVCLDETNRPQRVFHVSLPCRYCWQLPPELYKCEDRTKCRAVNCPRKRHIVTCTVLADVHCLGKRTFQKMVYCNWTGGYKWSTALALSITLGGFGADRFYLGQWREGLGKLFSFGGLGVWTLLDVILIAVGYIGPADGSLYI